MNSSISSIQSENKPPKSAGPKKKNSKLHEEIEIHVKTETKRVEKELAGEWNEILEQCLNDELSQAEEILIEEIESFVAKSLSENYMKIRENSLATVEDTYRAKGFKITPSQVRPGYSPSFSFAQRGKSKKGIEKIHLESDDMQFDSSLSDTNDLRLEVVKYIERSIENLADKFEKVSQDIISSEINLRIHRMKNMICTEVQEFIVETINDIKNELERCVQERVKEIVSYNQEKLEIPFRDKTDGPYREKAGSQYRDKSEGNFTEKMEGNFKDKMEFNFKDIPYQEKSDSNIKERADVPYREQFGQRYSPVEHSYKPKYEENYDFIENLANNYSGMKSNPSDAPNLSGSFTRDHKPSNKKPGKKGEKPNIPRTDVSAVLQQFLKK